MAGHGFGGVRKDHLEGGKREDRCVLPAGQTNSKSASSQGGERHHPWKHGAGSMEPDGGLHPSESSRTL